MCNLQQVCTIVLKNHILSCFLPLQASAVLTHTVVDNDKRCVFILLSVDAHIMGLKIYIPVTVFH